MSCTPKIKRRWIKEEKQIVHLIYRKGLISDFKIKDLYWAEYRRTGAFYRSSNGKHKWSVYLPEVHYCTVDYWGEADEHSLVRHVLESLYWANVNTEDWDEMVESYPPSSFGIKSRGEFIAYLKKLPTVISDNKIKKVTKRITQL